MDASKWDEFCAADEDWQAALINLAMRQAVKERGRDYVYVDPDGCEAGNVHAGVSCVYVNDKVTPARPSCLVGYVLHALGLPLDQMRHGDGVESWLADKPSWVETRGYLMLQAAQAVQDEGGTWGVAQRTAEVVGNAYQARRESAQ